MDDVLKTLLNGIAANSPLCAILLYAVYWLNKSNKGIIDSFNKERDERITGLEDHVNECNTDRKNLRDQIITLLTNQIKKP